MNSLIAGCSLLALLASPITVPEKRGVEFLNDLREGGIVAGIKYQSVSELMMRLEKLAPGFQHWATLLERRDKR